jgi:hypothetical protein
LSRKRACIKAKGLFEFCSIRNSRCDCHNDDPRHPIELRARVYCKTDLHPRGLRGQFYHVAFRCVSANRAKRHCLTGAVGFMVSISIILTFIFEAGPSTENRWERRVVKTRTDSNSLKLRTNIGFLLQKKRCAILGCYRDFMPLIEISRTARLSRASCGAVCLPKIRTLRRLSSQSAPKALACPSVTINPSTGISRAMKNSARWRH